MFSTIRLDAWFWFCDAFDFVCFYRARGFTVLLVPHLQQFLLSTRPDRSIISAVVVFHVYYRISVISAPRSIRCIRLSHLLDDSRLLNLIKWRAFDNFFRIEREIHPRITYRTSSVLYPGERRFKGLGASQLLASVWEFSNRGKLDRELHSANCQLSHVDTNTPSY